MKQAGQGEQLGSEYVRDGSCLWSLWSSAVGSRHHPCCMAWLARMHACPIIPSITLRLRCAGAMDGSKRTTCFVFGSRILCVWVWRPLQNGKAHDMGSRSAGTHGNGMMMRHARQPNLQEPKCVCMDRIQQYTTSKYTQRDSVAAQCIGVQKTMWRACRCWGRRRTEPEKVAALLFGNLRLPRWSRKRTWGFIQFKGLEQAQAGWDSSIHQRKEWLLVLRLLPQLSGWQTDNNGMAMACMHACFPIGKPQAREILRGRDKRRMARCARRARHGPLGHRSATQAGTVLCCSLCLGGPDGCACGLCPLAATSWLE